MQARVIAPTVAPGGSGKLLGSPVTLIRPSWGLGPELALPQVGHPTGPAEALSSGMVPGGFTAGACGDAGCGGGGCWSQLPPPPPPQWAALGAGPVGQGFGQMQLAFGLGAPPLPNFAASGAAAPPAAEVQFSMDDALKAAAQRGPCLLAPAPPAQALAQAQVTQDSAAAMQSAWASSALRTSNAAAELHKLMGAAKKIRETGGDGGPSAPAVAPAQRPAAALGGAAARGGVPAAFAAGSKKISATAAALLSAPADGADDPSVAAAVAAAQATNFDAGAGSAAEQLQNLAAMAQMQQFQQQQCFDIEEMQRMQYAMQMQMDAAAQLQQQEDTLKREAPPSPPRDFGRKQRRKALKENTEFYYDADKADEADNDPGVATSDLVKKVKLIKKSSARGYNAWESYTVSKGNKTKDPRLHHDDFLKGFLDMVAKGDYGEVPGATAILGECAKRFVPEQPKGDDRNERPYPKAVFIAGLPKNTNEQELRAHFETFGAVEAVRLKYDGDGLFRGIGEVEFYEENVSKKVLENFDYNIFQGRWINCMMAKRKGFLGRNPKWWSGTSGNK